MAVFSVDEARAGLARIRPALERFVVVRADAAELTAALRDGGVPTTLGGVPELKAAEALLDELITEIQVLGAQVKGVAPLLLDFPARLDGEDVLLCWLEGDAGLDWYHRVDLGFPGRRRLPQV
jgi:hypothetical protein